MPDSLPQRITDNLTQRDIELLRLASANEQEFEAAIDALTIELIRQLIRKDPTTVNPGAGQKRLDDVIILVAPMIRDSYREMYRTLRRQLIDVMQDEGQTFRRIVGDAMGLDNRGARQMVRIDLPRSSLTAIIDEKSITANANDAARLREFFEREAAAHHRRFTGQLRQAFLQDETITQMTRRLRQVTQIQAREVDGIIRTAYNHVVNNLRIETMQRNAHLFRGVIAVAVLDNRTSKICISRSRGMWDLNTGQPLPESPVKIHFPGPTPWHFNERTQLYPLTRTAQEIGEQGNREVKRALNSLTDEQRELLSVDPPADENYGQWLRRQSAAVQSEVLGPSRRRLWLEGQLSLQEDLVTQKGRSITLPELKRRKGAA